MRYHGSRPHLAAAAARPLLFVPNRPPPPLFRVAIAPVATAAAPLFRIPCTALRGALGGARLLPVTHHQHLLSRHLHTTPVQIPPAKASDEPAAARSPSSDPAPPSPPTFAPAAMSSDDQRTRPPRPNHPRPPRPPPSSKKPKPQPADAATVSALIADLAASIESSSPATAWERYLALRAARAVSAIPLPTFRALAKRLHLAHSRPSSPTPTAPSPETYASWLRQLALDLVTYHFAVPWAYEEYQLVFMHRTRRGSANAGKAKRLARMWAKLLADPPSPDPRPFHLFLQHALEEPAGAGPPLADVVSAVLQRDDLVMDATTYALVVRTVARSADCGQAHGVLEALVQRGARPDPQVLCAAFQDLARADAADSCALIWATWKGALLGRRRGSGSGSGGRNGPRLVQEAIRLSGAHALVVEMAHAVVAGMDDPVHLARNLNSWLALACDLGPTRRTTVSSFLHLLAQQPLGTQDLAWSMLASGFANSQKPDPAATRRFARGLLRGIDDAARVSPTHPLDGVSGMTLARVLAQLHAAAGPAPVAALVRSLAVRGVPAVFAVPAANAALAACVAAGDTETVTTHVWPGIQTARSADTQTLNYLLQAGATSPSDATAYMDAVTRSLGALGVQANGVTWSVLAQWTARALRSPPGVFALLGKAAAARQGSAPLLHAALACATTQEQVLAVARFLAAHEPRDARRWVRDDARNWELWLAKLRAADVGVEVVEAEMGADVEHPLPRTAAAVSHLILSCLAAGPCTTAPAPAAAPTPAAPAPSANGAGLPSPPLTHSHSRRASLIVTHPPTAALLPPSPTSPSLSRLRAPRPNPANMSNDLPPRSSSARATAENGHSSSGTSVTPPPRSGSSAGSAFAVNHDRSSLGTQLSSPGGLNLQYLPGAAPAPAMPPPRRAGSPATFNNNNGSVYPPPRGPATQQGRYAQPQRSGTVQDYYPHHQHQQPREEQQQVSVEEEAAPPPRPRTNPNRYSTYLPAPSSPPPASSSSRAGNGSSRRRGAPGGGASRGYYNAGNGSDYATHDAHPASPPQPPPAVLVYTTSHGGRQEYPVRADAATTIGRREGNDIMLQCAKISKFHAYVQPQLAEDVGYGHAGAGAGADGGGGFRYFLVDNKSSNGTRLNDVFISQHVPLNDGDRIQIGTVDLAFYYTDGPAYAARNGVAVPPEEAGRFRANGNGSGGGGAGGPKPPAKNIDLVMILPPEEQYEETVAIRAELDGESPQTDFPPASEIEDVDTLKEDYEKLRLAYELSKLSYASSIHDHLAKMVDLMFSVLPVDRGVVLLVDNATNLLVTNLVHLRPGAGYEGREILLSSTILQRVYKTRKCLVTSDASEDPDLGNSKSIAKGQIRSVLCVPIIAHEEVLGILHLDSRNRINTFLEKDVALVQTIINQTAIQIENSVLFEQLQTEVRVTEQLKRFLPPQAVERMAKKKEGAIKKGGHEMTATIVFADIRGFTNLSERCSPSEVFDLLNDYFERLVQVVFKYNGVVDKFIGDALMAVFGTLDGEAEAGPTFSVLNSVMAALEFQKAIEEMNEERARQGKEPISIGIGLNTGRLITGFMGAQARLEYTCIGDTVNLASRICGFASHNQVLMSEETLKYVKGRVDVRFQSRQQFKGKERECTVYEALGLLEDGLLENASEVSGMSSQS
ncbi:hypothetical protein H9P43_009473 [Blastocladiella emersonii ATCC 22665]|nr:hypothetical protein H9P43_009473 [Blastocladiella emersonii ATCC 22665]